MWHALFPPSCSLQAHQLVKLPEDALGFRKGAGDSPCLQSLGIPRLPIISSLESLGIPRLPLISFLESLGIPRGSLLFPFGNPSRDPLGPYCFRFGIPRDP